MGLDNQPCADLRPLNLDHSFKDLQKAEKWRAIYLAAHSFACTNHMATKCKVPEGSGNFQNGRGVDMAVELMQFLLDACKHIICLHKQAVCGQKIMFLWKHVTSQVNYEKKKSCMIEARFTRKMFGRLASFGKKM